MNNFEQLPEQLIQIYETLVNHLDEGIHVINREGITLLYNDKMAEIESMSKEDVLHKRLLDLFHFQNNQHSTLLQALFQDKTTRNVKQTYFNRDGKEITTVNNTYPIRIQGQVVGAVEIARDITKVEKLLQENMSRKDAPSYTFQNIIGDSAPIQEVIEHARRATRTNSSVLIVGETGTGKELFAQSIHNASTRSYGPFISQNCAALPETLIEGLLFGTTRGAFTGAIDRPGLVEMAEGGTLLLDELNSLTLPLQARLLRVLQEKVVRRIGGTKDKSVDVRIIATMNEDPLDAVLQNRLRKDLYYRLSVVSLFVPPLRDRKQDLPLLTYSFVEKYNRLFQMAVKTVDEEVMAYFQAYNWPGNVRELEHLVEGAMNMIVDEEKISFEHLPYPMRQRFQAKSALQNTAATANPTANLSHLAPVAESLDTASDAGTETPILRGKMRAFEQELLEKTLTKHHGNISQTAKELGISRQSLQYRFVKWNLGQPPRDEHP